MPLPYTFGAPFRSKGEAHTVTFFLIGLLLGGMYGFIWAAMIFGPADDDAPMPADQRERDRWRRRDQ